VSTAICARQLRGPRGGARLRRAVGLAAGIGLAFGVAAPPVRAQASRPAGLDRPVALVGVPPSDWNEGGTTVSANGEVSLAVGPDGWVLAGYFADQSPSIVLSPLVDGRARGTVRVPLPGDAYPTQSDDWYEQVLLDVAAAHTVGVGVRYGGLGTAISGNTAPCCTHAAAGFGPLAALRLTEMRDPLESTRPAHTGPLVAVTGPDRGVALWSTIGTVELSQLEPGGVRTARISAATYVPQTFALEAMPTGALVMSWLGAQGDVATGWQTAPNAPVSVDRSHVPQLPGVDLSGIPDTFGGVDEDLAVDARGEQMATYVGADWSALTGSSASDTRLPLWATFSQARGPWGRPQIVGWFPPFSYTQPPFSGSIGGNDVVAVAWTGGTGLLARSGTVGHLGPLQRISGANVQDLDVGVDARGRELLVWDANTVGARTPPGENAPTEVWASEALDGGRFGRPEPLTSPRRSCTLGYAGNGLIFSDDGRRAVLLWTCADGEFTSTSYLAVYRAS